MLSYLAFLCFLLSLALSCTALWLDRRSPLNRAMAISGGLYSFWAFCYVFVYSATDLGLAYLFYQISFIGAYFTAPALFAFYLVLSGKSTRFRWFTVTPVYLITAVVGVLCLLTNFRHIGFVSGPWGNVGIIAPQAAWSTVLTFFTALVQIYAMIAMIQARAKESSQRKRRLLTIVIISLIVIIVLFAVALRLERVFGIPPIMVLVGGPFVVQSFYLVVKFRYLRTSHDLIEKQLSTALKDGVVFLDDQQRILSVNTTAEQYFSLAAPQATGIDISTLLDGPEIFLREWTLAKNRRLLHSGFPCRIAGQPVTIQITPHYDRFNDFTGAVLIIVKLADFDAIADRFGISAREKEIIAMLRQGFRNQEIADLLFVSVGTIKNHIFRIFQKTNVANRVELTKLFSGGEAEAAIRQTVVDPVPPANSAL